MANKRLKASVIIPAYNAENTLSNCLQALLEQSTSKDEYEIIVIDDGSKDKTVEVARDWGVKVISQPKLGPAIARNKGAVEAKGDVLLFIDSDCIADYHWLEEMLKPFSDFNIAGVQGNYKTKQNELIARFAQIEIEDRYNIMRRYKYIDFIGTYAAGYRKDIFIKMGMFDNSFPIASGEDADFSYRLSQCGYKMVFNLKAIVYHKHPSTLKSYLKQKYWRAYWRNLAYKKSKKKTLQDTYTPQILKLQILLILLILLTIFFLPWLGKIVWYEISLLLLIFFASTIPFAYFAAKNDLLVSILSPMLIFLRSLIFLFGISSGFANEIILKKLRYHKVNKN